MQDLIYAGTLIHQRHDMLSLTDMWKAAGSPEKQRPADWKNDTDNVSFLNHVALISNTAADGIWRGQRGNGGSTFAHWQIGLAYAKYISPEFHAWCNEVVRERMTGRPMIEALTASQTGGIVKAITHKALDDRLVPVEQRLVAIAEQMQALMAGFDPSQAIVADYQPMLTLLQERGIKPKKRRQLSQRCSSRCKRWLIGQGRGEQIRVSRETRRYLFQFGAAQEWMRAEGNTLIAEHEARIAGQTIMQFKPGPKLVAAPMPDHPGEPQ